MLPAGPNRMLHRFACNNQNIPNPPKTTNSAAIGSLDLKPDDQKALTTNACEAKYGKTHKQ